MKLARITAWLLALCVLLGGVAPVSAEEITLKDGQKIVGTIVGYEKDMFRVETDYGIALIRKDKVVSIEVSKPQTPNPPTPSAAPKKLVEVKPTQPAATTGIQPTTPEPPHALATSSSSSTKPPTTLTPPSATFPGPSVTPPKPSEARPVAPPPTANPSESASKIAVAPSASPTPAPILPQISRGPTAAIKLQEPAPIEVKTPTPIVPAKPPSPPPPPVSHPIDVPLPAHLEDHLDGNTYFSDTFHFSMYKPPDWKIFEGVTKETGSGIMAMGTDDEQTVLIVDRQVWSGTPKLSSDEVEAKFRQTYQDYRQLSLESTQCAGQPATRRRFTGALDGVEWHGMAVHVIRGNMVFGITGVTSAETFGFQEAIFNKIANSVNFLTPAESISASPKP